MDPTAISEGAPESLRSRPQLENGAVTIGILGAARIAPLALIQPTRKCLEVQIQAIAARDPARAGRMARRHGIPIVHASYEALLQDPSIEAVYIPLPNALHCEWSLRALAAGKHVLCEKPMGANAEEAKRMVEAASRAGLVLAEGMHYRYHPLAEWLRAVVRSGELGEIRHLEADLCIPMLRRSNIRFDYELAGGATMDVGCYTIHLLRLLGDSEPEVTKADALLASEKVDRRMRAELRFPDGKTGRLTCSLLSSDLLRLRASAQGTRGVLSVWNPYLPHLFHSLKIRTPEGRSRQRVSGESSYVCQLRAFASAVRGGPPLPTGGADAIANLRVIDAIYRISGLPVRGLRPGALT